MRKSIYLLILFATISHFIFGQKQMKFGNNSFHISSTSVLELESSNRGLQLPRLTSVQANSILSTAKSNNASGLVIYNTDCKCLQVFDATTATGKWTNITENIPTSPSWSLSGNSGTLASSNFLGTTDNTDFLIKTNNLERMRITSTGETDFANQIVHNFSAKVIEKITSNYTLSSIDNGSVMLFNHSDSIQITVPSSLPIGFNISVYQIGTGTITFIESPGTVILQKNNFFTTSGQYAGASLLIVKAGTAILNGDLN